MQFAKMSTWKSVDVIVTTRAEVVFDAGIGISAATGSVIVLGAGKATCSKTRG